MRVFTDSDIKEIVRLYKSGLGTTKILRKLEKGSLGSVKNVLRRQGIKMRLPYRGRPMNSFPGLFDCKDIIDGLLLGDGGLFPINEKHKNSGLTVTQANKSLDFLKFIENILLPFNVPSKIYKRPASSASVLYTPRSIEFTQFRKRWYPDEGKKIIPKDLSLSPTGLLLWFMGDGTRYKAGGLQLYTNSFTFPDVEFLISIIKKQFDISGTIRKHVPGTNSWAKDPWKPCPIIYIPVAQARIFHEVIGPSPCKSMLHKWPGQ